jgi:xylulokinase
MTAFLGIDIGTFESKGVITDAQGRILAQAARPHRMIVPRPGWAEHRADEDWWGDFAALSRELIAQAGLPPGRIAGVAASAIGPCLLPVDAAGAPLMNGILYGVDTRAAAQIGRLTAAIGAETILSRCGNALTSQSVGPKILWLKEERPEVFARTDRVGTSTTYLTWKLTGEWVIDHYTAANFAPLYDVWRLDWTDDLAPGLIPRSALPRLMWSGEIAGRVTLQAAAETGLAPGTPVTCGTIDAAAEAVSVGVAAPGDTMMMYGSTVFMIQVTAAPLRDARLWYAPWLAPGTHASMAGLATSGTLTHWFRDTLAPGADFAALAEEAAAAPPGARGLIVLPYFSGERTPIHDPLAKGAVFGLNLTHTRGDMFRAVLEGIAMGTAHVVETWREAGAPPATLRAVGGGTRNEVWLRATSDFTGLPQVLCATTTGAAYGDAFLAACATGRAQAPDITRWNPAARDVTPAPEPWHAQRYALFRALDAATRPIARALG